MISRTALALLAASALALAACGSGDDSSSAPTSADLDGQAFESTDVTGHELVADSTITLAFETDSISANAGCNTMNAGYSITDGALEVDVMAATMMACPDELMAQDTWLSEFLTGGPEIALDDGTLILTGADASITLAAIEDAELIGTTWVVSGTVANEAVTSSRVDSEASLTITDDGIVEVDTGCNTGSGTVEVTDSTLTFGPIAATLMACDEELNRLEASVLATLQGEVSYEIDGSSLSLRTDGPDGEIGLELTAQP